ncbi:hypothetical protein SAMN05192583_0228 [Sphingomonas gellani]|uniref:Phage shock protein B n=1 Tax=Sphingomonas gellani TaxID=1166340 RepID=A0A1H7YFZ2_9SPHN|nr:hypothetical protein [Sphingomonas gellani]SEM44248.1 hypothetical protein SAMN05192583_0228 [Sphingomonas gellani]
MGPGTVIMVLGIVLIVMIGRVLRARYEAHGGAGMTPRDNHDSLRLRDEVQQLKDRIQVLERVITDNHSSVDLDRQIERLRDR